MLTPLTNRWLALLPLIGLFLTAGCEPPKPATVRPLSSTSTTTPPAAGTPADGTDEPELTTKPLAEGTREPAPLAPRIPVEIATWDDCQQRLGSYRGKVIVIDLWSLSCDPCRKEFPNLVALQAQFPDQVVAISFNCEYVGQKKKPPEYYRGPVEEFLAHQKAEKLVNLMSSTASDELFESLELDSIPAVYVYDTEGKLKKRFDNRTVGDAENVYQTHITPYVQKLLQPTE